MATLVPTATRLSEIYYESDIPAQSQRWTALRSKFQSLYGHPPTFISRSPGRLNIIGEHIDYSLYPVLPMAITADVLLAVSFSPASTDDNLVMVELANVRGETFPSRQFCFPGDGEVVIDAGVHEWTNYFKSGLRGALELLRGRWAGGGVGEGRRPVNMKVLMDGRVPVGGGLSSSAAFVTASALAVAVANGVGEVDKRELTQLAIVSERAVGVNSGGMDQSASVFSQRGSALLVEFSPELKATPIRIPPTEPKLVFMVAQSFVAADKHVTGPIHYNLRVVECTLAAAYLNALLNPPGTQLPPDSSPLGISLQGFTTIYQTYNPTTRLVDLAHQTLTKEEGYTDEEIAAVLGMSLPGLQARFMSRFPVRYTRLKLRQRALHVFSETERVQAFTAKLAALDGATDAEQTGRLSREMGRLLDETQESCRVLYECSCAEIDRICEIARRAGAYGSRLTGAGWGGCTVHLVPEGRVGDVRGALEGEYYAGMGLSDEQMEGAMVVSLPGSGSSVVMGEFAEG